MRVGLIESRSDKEQWLGLKEWSKRLFQVRQRQLKGRRAGWGKGSTFHNWTHRLVYSPHIFLQSGRHNLGHFLQNVPRKLSNMFSLGMFLSLSKTIRISALTAKGREQGRGSTASGTKRILDWQSPNFSITQALFLNYNPWKMHWFMMDALYWMRRKMWRSDIWCRSSPQASLHPSLISLAFFYRSGWVTFCMFRAEVSAEGQVLNFTAFSLTASLCKLWLNTVYVVTVENILLMDI